MGKSVNPNNVSLGHAVANKIYGYEGIVTCRIDHLNGMLQFIVKTQCKEGELPETKACDAAELVRLKGSPLKDVQVVNDCNTKTPAEIGVELGDEAKHTLTGIKGVVVEIWTSINGKIEICIGIKEKFKDDDYILDDSIWFEVGKEKKVIPKGKETGCSTLKTFNNL